MSYYMSKMIHAPFDKALRRVTFNLQKEGFSIVTQLDMQETFKTKLNMDFRKYLILGICNAPFTYKVLQKEAKIGLLLPCNVVVDEVSPERIEVSIVDPVAGVRAIDSPSLLGEASQIRDKLKVVLEAI
ncbi:MAG: DUF302 domain-containing protein [Candidatus Edwardsbacteria bacterium]|nr:DUF302 domain-containing protein [Candidatus Edwardsbacteria bacterium]